MLGSIKLDLIHRKPDDLDKVKSGIQQLDSDISDVSKSISGLSSSDQNKIKSDLDTVTQNQSTLKARTELYQWIQGLSQGILEDLPLKDPSSE